MEEIYQITAALKHLSFGKHVAVLTTRAFRRVDGRLRRARGPEALAGGTDRARARRRLVQIVVDRNRLVGSVDLVGRDGLTFGARRARACSRLGRLAADLAPDPDLPDDTRLWAALQQVGGGTWGGCVTTSTRFISLRLARTAIRAHLLRWARRGKP